MDSLVKIVVRLDLRRQQEVNKMEYGLRGKSIVIMIIEMNNSINRGIKKMAKKMAGKGKGKKGRC